MKKLFIIFLSCVIVGCSNKRLDITNIQSINYNNIFLLEDDFESINKYLNNIDFEKKDIKDTEFKPLKIISEKDVYNFKVIENNIYYEKNNNKYVSIDANSLINELNNLEAIYTDFSFVDINYNDCNTKTNELVIKIDASSKCLTLNIHKPLHNFKIHTLENINDNFNEVGLIYQKDSVSNNIMIRHAVKENPKIRISFETKYNYIISITPIYNEDDNQINLQFLYRQKK